jgi:hypothetical protein
MLYFILAPNRAIFVDPIKTVQVKNGYQLFWREQKRTKNLWNLFLDKNRLCSSLKLPSPDQYTCSIVAFRTMLGEMKLLLICRHSSPKLVPRVN